MSKLFGQFQVKPTNSAFSDARSLFPRVRDYQELRRQALKLAFWPSGETTVSGQVCDLDWDIISGMSHPKAYELRIDDEIGGFNNLRLIFYVFRKDLTLPGDLLPRLWILAAMQKKTQRFSVQNLKTFAARVTLIQQRWYREYL